MKTLPTLILSLLIFASCTKSSDPFIHNVDDIMQDDRELVLPEETQVYVFDEQTTSGFVTGFRNVTITNEIATLGRVLFYDNKLSIDGSTSCGSCHKQEFGFGDNLAFSPGVNGHKSERNSMSLVNLLSERNYFWDGRTDSLQLAVLEPFLNHKEMGMMAMEHVIERVESLKYYRSLFAKAYNTDEVTDERIGGALAAFIASIPHQRAKSDKVYFGWIEFTEEELNGARHFSDFGCWNCHQGFSKSSAGRWMANLGEFSNSQDPGNDGLFNIPSLRNVGISAPYMHDGSLETLEDVMEFYRSEDLQIRDDKPFDWQRHTRKKFIDMTDTELDELVAYLKTFTDEELMVDDRFSDPFKR